MKKRIVIVSLLALILTLAMGGTALASHPPETHHHHIHLPNGTCLDIVSKHDGMKRADDSNAAVEFHHAFQHSCPD